LGLDYPVLAGTEQVSRAYGNNRVCAHHLHH
jgi:hypothetical protein